MALSMDAGLRRSLRTYAARTKKGGGALAAPPEEQKRPGWGKAASSFTSSYRVLRLSVGRNTRAVPIARLFKIAQF